MKKFQFWTLALTTLLFGACSDDKTAPQPQPEGTASIGVRVSGTPTAKATGSSHNAHESIDIKNLQILVFANGVKAGYGKAEAEGATTSVTEVKGILVTAGQSYNVYAFGNVYAADGTTMLDLSTITKVDELPAIENIANQFSHSTVAGKATTSSLQAGQNALGYGASPTTGTSVGDDFKVKRIVAKVMLTRCEKETSINTNLTINKVYILNGKNQSKLTGTSLKVNGFENFVYGSNPGGTTPFKNNTLYPGSYHSIPKDPTTITPTTALADNWPNGGVSSTAPLYYYLFENNGNEAASGEYSVITDHKASTMLVIEGKWKDDPSVAGEGETVYYPIIINVNTGQTQEYTIIRNNVYDIQVTITRKGANNPWVAVNAWLDAQITLEPWNTPITQSVIW